MQAPNEQRIARHARREFIALLVGSLVFAAVLLISLGEWQAPTVFGYAPSALLLFAVLASSLLGVIALAAFLATRSFRLVRAAREEISSLKLNLQTAEAIFRTEPQVLIFWDQVEGLQVVTHTLTTIEGLPQKEGQLLRFGSWLDQASAHSLKDGLDHLFADGRAFTLYLRLRSGAEVEADGRATGTRAVLRLRDVAGAKRDFVRILDRYREISNDIRASRALLDVLPFPVWLKSNDGRIKWVNARFVAAVEADEVAEVYDKQLELVESKERDALDGVARSGQFLKDRLELTVGKVRKPYDVYAVGTDNLLVAAAVDVGEVDLVQGELDRQIEAFDRTLDRITTPVAIFNKDRFLVFFNRAYQDLWDFDPGWLDQRPDDGAILDRLKELSMLPAVVDYRRWKQDHLRVYQSSEEVSTRWQLPDGRTLQVHSSQRPDGGVTHIFEDISERLALESKYNALIHVQRETLNGLSEGVAVFATDGRLELVNASFKGMWRLTEIALEHRPHIDEILRCISAVFGPIDAWSMIKETVTSLTYERQPSSGQIQLRHGAVIDFAVTPLPHGGTLATFSDVTNAEKLAREAHARSEAQNGAHYLNRQILRLLSHDMRSALTTVLGFGELLTDPQLGTLSDQQREYLADMASASTNLVALVEELSDVVSADVGGLEMRLVKIDIRAAIDEAMKSVRDDARRLRLTLEIATADNIEYFEGDQARIQLLFRQLLANAVSSSEVGGTVRFACWRSDRNLVFSVEDGGIAVANDPFTQILGGLDLTSPSHSLEPGVLRLAIAKSIIDMHEGHLELRPEADGRRTVLFRLPQSQHVSQLPELNADRDPEEDGAADFAEGTVAKSALPY
ncbi:MAG: PAS-domain containing protein [Hyphomicrobiaceae bacterium]